MTATSPFRLSRSLCGVLILAVCAMIMVGCSVTSNFPVVENQTLPGSFVPLPLLNLPLVPGLYCNLPDKEDFDKAVSDALGSFLSRWIAVKGADLNTMTLEVAENSPGDFSGITHVKLALYLLDVNGLSIETVQLGEANAANGFGRKMEVKIDPAVDLVKLVGTSAECGAVALTVGGTYSAKDVVFNLKVRVKIRPKLKL